MKVLKTLLSWVLPLVILGAAITAFIVSPPNPWRNRGASPGISLNSTIGSPTEIMSHSLSIDIRSLPGKVRFNRAAATEVLQAAT
jgi:hypothetical protein